MKGETVVFIILALIAMLATVIFFVLSQKGVIFPEASVSKELTTETASETERGAIDLDEFPVIPGGLFSWKEVLQEIEKNQDFFHYLRKMTGLSLDEIRLLVRLESEGYNYSISLPRGTVIVNSGRKDGVFFQKEGSLGRDRTALTELRGVPVILVSCGNPIRLISQQPKPEPRKSVKPKPPKLAVVQEPILRTDNVLSVTQTSAQLAGFVDPRSESVVVWFEYGEGNLLNRRISEFSVSSAGSITRTISGLHPQRKYSFRIVVRNSVGIFYGNTRTFMTDISVQAPVIHQPKFAVVQEPILRTDNVLSVTQTSAQLAGFVDPRSESVVVWFEYGEGNLLNRRISEFSVSSAGSITRTISGLHPQRKYSFRIVVRIDGRTFYGNTRTFTTDF